MVTRYIRLLTFTLTLLAVGSSSASPNSPDNPQPPFIKGEILSQYYAGKENDLLTAGLGAKAIGLACALNKPKQGDPKGCAEVRKKLTPQNPDNPTASELRRLAIYYNYNALIDVSEKAGYGRLYGPNVPDHGHDGRVAGWEYLAYSDNGTGEQNVVLMVQVPDTFDYDTPCIVTGPSSGSRGIYGAIGTSGAWGLKKSCAVAYTDKGTGNGVDDLSRGTVNLIDGTRTTAKQAGDRSHFTARGDDLPLYNQEFPNRIAMKHAHSQQNPEADWGKNVLQSIEFAFFLLNSPKVDEEPKRFLTPENTIVIASSISNGGAASLRAAEQDEKGLIDGVVVSEPNINPSKLPEEEGFKIQQGDITYQHAAIGKPMVDYVNYYGLYQPCVNAGFNCKDFEKFPGRCTVLHQAGLLKAQYKLSQIQESQQKLNDYALLPSTNFIAYFYEALNVYEAIATLYPMAYGRFPVTDNLCGYSYAYADQDGPPQPKPLALLALDFAVGGGIPPANQTFVINNHGNDGKGANFTTTRNSKCLKDKYFVGALCTRTLTVGHNPTGQPLTDKEKAQHERIKKGGDAIYGTGDLQGKPAIIIHGRDDALIAVNHSSRYYYALNHITEGKKSRLSYIEIKHAHHLDALNRVFPELGHSQIPLHYYFEVGLELMYAHLHPKLNQPLPKSQVVPTHPSGQTLQRHINLPDIGSEAVCLITFDEENKVLSVPECDKPDP